MSDGQSKNSQADGSQILFPDFAELWKEFYFKNENAWADAFKEFVSTETFVKMLDQTMNQHLCIEKVARQNLDKLFEIGSAPSKKDVARIAELVISVEEKLDNLDCQIMDSTNHMTEAILSLVQIVQASQQEMAAIKEQNTEIKKQNLALKNQLKTLQKQIAALPLKNESLAGNREGTGEKNRGRKTKVLNESAEQE